MRADREARDLLRFVAGATISNAGSFMQATAVPFVLFRLTDANAWVGAAVFATLGCSVLIGPVAGIAIDRFGQKTVLMLGQVVQLASALALWLLAVTDAMRPWPILGLVAIGGFGSGFQFPAAQSFVPTIVSPARIARAIRLTTLGLTVSRTVGPAIAGLVLSVTGAATLFALNAATFVVYFVLLVPVRPRRPATVGTAGSWVGQYGAALRHVRERPGLVAILSVGAVGALLGASFAFLVPGIADLYGAGAGGVGALTACYGAGAIVGSTVLVRAGDRIGRARATRLGFVGFALGGLVAMGTGSLAVGIGAFVVIGIGYSLWLTSIGTALQIQLEDDFRGRITTLYVTAVVGGTPIGAIVAGAVGDAVGLRPILAGYCVALLGIAVLGRGVLRYERLDDAPAAREAPPVVAPPA